MRALNAGDLLHIWEWGQGRSPTAQALLMLSVARPDISPQALANLPIGQRDGQLLKLRSHTFGPHLQATARCPQCAEILEYRLAVQDIMTPPIEAISPTEDEKAAIEPALYHWEQGDYAASFRLPTSADLLAEAASSDDAPNETASAALMQRCLVSICKQGETTAIAELPAEIRSALEERIAQQDPQAEIVLNLSCLACEHQWSILFDIVVFFWREITATAQRLLQEVHLLASAYGWREADILTMTPQRRAAYLTQISGDVFSSQTSSFSPGAGL